MTTEQEQVAHLEDELAHVEADALAAKRKADAAREAGDAELATRWDKLADGYEEEAAEMQRYLEVLNAVKKVEVRGAHWRVLRHSGRGSGSEEVAGWKEKFAGPEDEARERYRKLQDAMRQGGVRLVKPDGTTDSERWAPRLRMRW
jgi:hypothetical protein